MDMEEAIQVPTHSTIVEAEPQIIVTTSVFRESLSSGVIGLDIILGGSFINRSTYLIAGNSGTGKTVLTQQIAFHQASQGNKVLYLTFLSESHEKMLANLQDFTFFDRNLVGTNINYLSLYHEVSTQGVAGLVALARETVLRTRAKVVMVDGVSALRDFSTSRRELRKELFDLNSQLSTLGCTIFLIVDDKLPPSDTPEYAVADGVICLRNETYGRRHVRSIEIVKARGAVNMGGLHYFDLTNAGIVIYPRTEAFLSSNELTPPPPPQPDKRLTFGIAKLDQMLNGGLLFNSVNLMLGAPGNGKTLTGLRFLYEGALQGEKTMILSFQHPAEHLKVAAQSVGFNLSPYIDDGSLRVLWLLPLKRHLDEVAQALFRALEEHQPTRLLVDSFGDMEDLSLPSERLDEFWIALTNYLRGRPMTTLGVLEFNQIIGATLEVPHSSLGMRADSLIFLRTMEITGQLKRAISIVKLRDSAFDSRVCEYTISENGISVGEPFADQSTALKGTSNLGSRVR